MSDSDFRKALALAFIVKLSSASKYAFSMRSSFVAFRSAKSSSLLVAPRVRCTTMSSI